MGKNNDISHLSMEEIDDDDDDSQESESNSSSSQHEQEHKQKEEQQELKETESLHSKPNSLKDRKSLIDFNSDTQDDSSIGQDMSHYTMGLDNLSDLQQPMEHDEGEDKEEEPKLKFKLLNGSIQEITNSDKFSCITVSNRFLVVGSVNGKVYMLDLEGNQVSLFESHSAQVNDLYIDADEEFLASASDDGSVVITSIFGTEKLTFSFKRPVKTVSLEPAYSKSSSRRFVFGGLSENVGLNGKGWFGTSTMVIHAGEGPIYKVIWVDEAIVWINDAGIRFYDPVTSQKFGFIEKQSLSSNHTPSTALFDPFNCSMLKTKDNDICIGSMNSIQILRVKSRNASDVQAGLSAKVVEIILQIQTDFIVCGVATRENGILALGYPFESNDEDRYGDFPKESLKTGEENNFEYKLEIHLFDQSGHSFYETSLNDPSFFDAKTNFREYRLGHLPGLFATDDIYYIMSPTKIMTAKPTNVEDHIQYLRERKRYYEIVDFLSENNGEKNEIWMSSKKHEMAMEWIELLIEAGDYEEAAYQCANMLRDDVELWEHVIQTFIDDNMTLVILPYIPFTNPKLPEYVYTQILLSILYLDHSKFDQSLRNWPHDSFSIKSLLGPFDMRLTEFPTDIHLLKAGVLIYEENQEIEKAVLCGLRSFHPNVIQKIKQSGFAVSSLLSPNILLLLDYDQHMIQSYFNSKTLDKSSQKMHSEFAQEGDIPEEYIKVIKQLENQYLGLSSIPEMRIRVAVQCPALGLLVYYIDRLNIHSIIEQLKEYSKYLHIFLDALFQKDCQLTLEYHDLQVLLYAEYDHHRLLPFLKKSTNYNMIKALEICQSRRFIQETIFLLAKMGNTKQALMMIIEEVGDVKQAIDFIKSQNDPVLWTILVETAMNRHNFIPGILENLSLFPDSKKVIRRLPVDIHVKGIKQALTKIFNDYEIQSALMEGSLQILKEDIMTELRILLKETQFPIEIDKDYNQCHSCQQLIKDGEYLIFKCRHMLHTTCSSIQTVQRKKPKDLDQKEKKLQTQQQKQLNYDDTLKLNLQVSHIYRPRSLGLPGTGLNGTNTSSSFLLTSFPSLLKNHVGYSHYQNGSSRGHLLLCSDLNSLSLTDHHSRTSTTKHTSETVPPNSLKNNNLSSKTQTRTTSFNAYQEYTCSICS